MKQGGHLLQHIDQGSTGKQFQIGQYLIITGTPCMNLFTGFPTLSGEEAFYLRMDVLYPRLYMISAKISFNPCAKSFNSPSEISPI